MCSRVAGLISWSRDFVEDLLKDGSIVATWNIPSLAHFPIEVKSKVHHDSTRYQSIYHIYFAFFLKRQDGTHQTSQTYEFHFNILVPL